MELNPIGALTMFKTMDMVPNFSELARTFGRDRHTIKKMYEEEGRKRRKKKYCSTEYRNRAGQARHWSRTSKA